MDMSIVKGSIASPTLSLEIDRKHHQSAHIVRRVSPHQIERQASSTAMIRVI